MLFCRNRFHQFSPKCVDYRKVFCAHLYECLVPDHGVEGGDVCGQVHVQQQGVPHLVQSGQAGGVVGLVEALDYVA